MIAPDNGCAFVDNISENDNCSPFFDPAVPFMYKRVKGAAISLSSDYNNFYVGYQGDADSTAGKLLSKESGILTRIVPIDVDGRKANFLVSVRVNTSLACPHEATRLGVVVSPATPNVYGGLL